MDDGSKLKQILELRRLILEAVEGARVDLAREGIFFFDVWYLDDSQLFCDGETVRSVTLTPFCGLLMLGLRLWVPLVARGPPSRAMCGSWVPRQSRRRGHGLRHMCATHA